MKKMRSILALLLALTLSLSLTACGGGTKPGNDTSDPAPGGAQANREEGSLIFSIDWPAYIDPGVGNKAADMVAHLNLYDTLTFPLSDGTVAPLLAESWEANSEATEYTFHLVENATTVKTMVSRNELDITSNTLTKETLDSVAAVSGMALVRAKSGLSMNIALNTKVAPTDDIHFRKAMAYALDYNTVSTSIYPDSTQPTGPIVSGAACALKQEDNPYTFDLDKAVAELKQSPYYQELTSGSMVVSLTYCSEGGQPQEQLALLMQAGLAAIGIKCEITAKPFANMMTDAATVETTPNASFIVYSPSYMEGGSFLKPRYHSSSSGTWEQMEWLLDDELDAEIERAMNIVDEDERNTAYIQICKELVELCPTIWACDVASSYAYRSDYMRIPSVEAGYDALYCADYMMYYRDYTLK